MSASPPTTLQVTLTAEELSLLRDALDSHAYWELSDPAYRDSGSVHGPGSDDDGHAKELQRVEDLTARFRSLIENAT